MLGVQALGLGLGTLIHEFGVAPRIVVGHERPGGQLEILLRDIRKDVLYLNAED